MTISDYPETVTEILDDGMVFEPKVLQAMEVFKQSRPWRGSVERRKRKFRHLNHDLAAACGSQVIEPPLVRLGLMVIGSGGRRVTEVGLQHLERAKREAK